MRNPLWRLKTLPWGILLQNALLTVALASLLDIALLLLLGAIARSSFRVFSLGQPTSLLLALVISGGIGALSVILMERCFRQVVLDIATLWALVACLIVVFWLKSLLPIPALLVGLQQLQPIGLVLGLFAQGRAYWRR